MPRANYSYCLPQPPRIWRSAYLGQILRLHEPRWPASCLAAEAKGSLNDLPLDYKGPRRCQVEYHVQVSPSVTEDGICSSTIPSSDFPHTKLPTDSPSLENRERRTVTIAMVMTENTSSPSVRPRVRTCVRYAPLQGLEGAFYSKQASNHQGSSAILKCQILADSCNCYISITKGDLAHRGNVT